MNPSQRKAPAGLVIGLVNNMPEAARHATELQFFGLLAEAAAISRLEVELVAAGPLGDDVPAILRDARPDAVIVTGAEPAGETVREEPLWPALARLVDWAADHTSSCIWSCLAAHAAALRLDGLDRIRLPGKLSGVFTCRRADDHPLLAGGPSSWSTPHSRHNTLDESALRGLGYTILSRVSGFGVDSVAKRAGRSLFLLMQGHPEYGSDTLLREFRRDIKRFAAGRQDRFPDPPEGCFEPAVADALAAMQERDGRARSLEALALVEGEITVSRRPVWRDAAARLYANWLSYLARQGAGRHAAASGATAWRVAS